MRKSYNWAMIIILAATILFGFAVLNMVVDAISGLTVPGTPTGVDAEIVG